MSRFLTKQYNKIREKLHSFSVDSNIPMERLGSDYGGWSFPQGLINNESICYFAGAGTDVSFDLTMAKKHQPYIFIFDPTPGAIAHFEATKKGLLAGEEQFTQGKKIQIPIGSPL